MNASSASHGPIRLALVTTELGIGGAERNLVRLATGLHGNGFAVRVYSLKPAPVTPRDQLVRDLRAADVQIEFLQARAGWQVPLATHRLASHFKAWRPQIVQSFLFHANVMSTWACSLAKVENLLWGLRVADPNPRRIWLERRLAKQAERCVCVSESVRQFASEKLAIEPHKFIVIANGLESTDCEAVKPIDLPELGVRAGRRMLLCVGRLHEQKGFDWLLSFAPQLLEQLPDHDLVFVGDGPQRATLQALVAAAGLTDRIHLVGFREDVPRCLAAAELLMLPSRWEGMPNVVLEAMAMGLPVVATASHGVAEALGELAENQIVDLSDSSGFQQQVIAICTRPELARELGRANQNRVRRDFSIAAMLARYRQLYSDLIRE